MQLYIGDYSFTVGSVLYVDSYCDDPSHNCPALIGGIVGGVGGGLLVIIIIIIIVAIWIHHKRTNRMQAERDPFNSYISMYS